MKDVIQELKNLEGQYWRGMIRRDLDAVLGLTDFPCLVASSSGVMLVDKEKFTEMFSSRREEISRFEFLKEPEVRLLTPDTAVIAYTIGFTIGARKTEAADASTWVRRDGKWRCALHAEATAKFASKKQAA